MPSKPSRRRRLCLRKSGGPALTVAAGCKDTTRGARADAQPEPEWNGLSRNGCYDGSCCTDVLHAPTAPVSLPVWGLSVLDGAGTLPVRCAPAMAHGAVRENARRRTDGAQRPRVRVTGADRVVVQEDSTHAVRDVPVTAGRVLSRVSRPTPRLARGIRRAPARVLTGDELRMRGACATAGVMKEVGDLCTCAQLGLERATRAVACAACVVHVVGRHAEGGREGRRLRMSSGSTSVAHCTAVLHAPTAPVSLSVWGLSVLYCAGTLRAVCAGCGAWHGARECTGPYRRRTAAACQANRSRPGARLERQI